MTTRACAGSRNAHGACCSSVSRNFGLTTTCGSEIIRTILRTLWEQSSEMPAIVTHASNAGSLRSPPAWRFIGLAKR